MALLTMAAYFLSFNALHGGVETARTVALITLIMLEIGGAFVFRSFRKGVLGRSLLVNLPLFYASIASIIVTLAIIYTPARKVFETVPIGPEYWAVAIGLTALMILVYDVLKIINRKRQFMKMV